MYSPAPNPASTARVAQAVKEIVQLVLKEDYSRDTCLDYLSSLEPGADLSHDGMAQYCAKDPMMPQALNQLSGADRIRTQSVLERTKAVMAPQPH